MTLRGIPTFVMKEDNFIITTIINKLINTDTISRHFSSIGNGKILKEFLIIRYVLVMVLFMSVFLPGLDK